MNAGGVGHVLVDHLMDAPRRAQEIDLEGPGDLVRDRLPRLVEVEAHFAAEEILRAEVAEHQVGVSDRRLCAAAVIAHRPGFGAGTIRADLQQAELIDPRDTAAAGADFNHLDDRHLEREAAAFFEAVDPGSLEICGQERLAAVDQADLRGGAAHVEGDHPLKLFAGAVEDGGQGAGRGTGFDQTDGVFPRHTTISDATVGQHDGDVTRQAQGAQVGVELTEVPLRQRLDVDVRGGG